MDTKRHVNTRPRAAGKPPTKYTPIETPTSKFKSTAVPDTQPQTEPQSALKASSYDILCLPLPSEPLKPDLFATLPPELLLPILLYLSPTTIIRLRRVSKLMKDLVETLITDRIAWSLLPSCFPRPMDGSQQLSFTDLTAFTRRYSNLLSGRSVKVMTPVHNGNTERAETRAPEKTVYGSYMEKERIISVPGLGHEGDYLVWSQKENLFLHNKGHGDMTVGGKRQWDVSMHRLHKDLHHWTQNEIISHMADADLGAILLITSPDDFAPRCSAFHVSTGTILWSVYYGLGHLDSPNQTPVPPNEITDYLAFRASTPHPNPIIQNGYKICALFLLHPMTGAPIRPPLLHFDEHPTFVSYSGYRYPRLRAFAISPCKLLAAGLYCFESEEVDERDVRIGYGKSQIIIWEVVSGNSGNGILTSYEWTTPEWDWVRGIFGDEDFVLNLFFSENESRPGTRSKFAQNPNATPLALHEKRGLIMSTRSVLSYSLTLLSSMDEDYFQRPGTKPNPAIGKVRAISHTFALSTAFHPSTTNLSLKTYRTFKTPVTPAKTLSIIRLSPTSLDSWEHIVVSSMGFPAWGLVINFTGELYRLGKATVDIATFKVVKCVIRDCLKGHENLGAGQVECVEYEVEELNPLRLPPTVPDGNVAGEPSEEADHAKRTAKPGPKTKPKAVTKGKQGRKDLTVAHRVDNKANATLGPQLEYQCLGARFRGSAGLIRHYELGGRYPIGGMRYVTGIEQMETVLPGCVLYF